MPESVTHGGGYVRLIKAQTEQRLSTVEVQKVMEAIDCNNEARYLVTVRHANADRCFMSGVNYLVRSATTMMAGWVVLLFTLSSLLKLLLSSVAFPL